MRILVTGATGFIGRKLVNSLSKEHTILVLARDPERARSIFGRRASIIPGDITDPDSLSALARRRIDFVYHLAGEINEASPELWKVNVDGTRNLLEALKRKKIKRFVFLSSIGVLGESSQPLNEDSPYNPKTRYEESKAEAERIVMSYWLKYQIPYTIVRSTIVYGPNKVWARIIKAAKDGFPLIGSGNNAFHLIYIDDLISGLMACMSPIAEKKIYNLAGPDVMTYKETYKLICDLLKVKMPDRVIPKNVAKAYAHLHTGYKKMRGQEPDITLMPATIERLCRNRVVDISKARRELGWEPRVSLKNGMKITIRTLQKEGMV